MANNIARQVEGKISYRRAIKMSIASTMRMGAEGIKVKISGRLGGAEMARSEIIKKDEFLFIPCVLILIMPLAEAHTKVGLLGVKVWICNGEVFGKRDLSPNIGARNAKSKSLKRKAKK